MQGRFQDFWIRDWQPGDRDRAATVVGSVLATYGLTWDPEDADQDVVAVEQAYWASGGEFWVVERFGGQGELSQVVGQELNRELNRELNHGSDRPSIGTLVGTAAYRPIQRGDRAVELRKMYLLSEARGQGLGRWLLGELERAIAARGFRQIWLETATVLHEAIQLYERSGYRLATPADLHPPGPGPTSETLDPRSSNCSSPSPCTSASLVETARCDRVYIKQL